MSSDNEHSFLSMKIARLASSATQLSPIRRQLSSACALMQAGGQPGKLAGLQPEQSSSAQATPGRYLKRAKRAPWPPWIVNEVSSVQVRELDRAICAVTGQLWRVCGIVRTAASTLRHLVISLWRCERRAALRRARRGFCDQSGRLFERWSSVAAGWTVSPRGHILSLRGCPGASSEPVLGPRTSRR